MQFMWEHEDHCTLGKLHNTFEELCYPKVGSSFFLFNCALVYISFYTWSRESGSKDISVVIYVSQNRIAEFHVCPPKYLLIWKFNFPTFWGLCKPQIRSRM